MAIYNPKELDDYAKAKVEEYMMKVKSEYHSQTSTKKWDMSGRIQMLLYKIMDSEYLRMFGM